MQKLSKNGRIYKSVLLITVGLVLLLLISNFFGNLFGKSIATLLVIGVILIRWQTVDLYFNEHELKLGKKKINYDQIVDIKGFGFNFEYYLIFKLKNESFINSYKFVDLRVFSLLDFIKMLRKRKVEFPFQEFANLLLEKSAIKKARIRKAFSIE